MNKSFWNEEDILTIIKYKEKYKENLRLKEIILNQIQNNLYKEINKFNEDIKNYQINTINELKKNIEKITFSFEKLDKEIQNIEIKELSKMILNIKNIIQKSNK